MVFDVANIKITYIFVEGGLNKKERESISLTEKALVF